jgi:hypothetical protein
MLTGMTGADQGGAFRILQSRIDSLHDRTEGS